MNHRSACYHGRVGHATGCYGRRVTVLVMAKRNRRGAMREERYPVNALVKFEGGERIVTSVGCLRWKCEKHGGAT